MSSKNCVSARPLERSRLRKAIATTAFLIALSAGAPPTWVQDTSAAALSASSQQVVVSFDAFDPAQFTAASFAD